MSLTALTLALLLGGTTQQTETPRRPIRVDAPVLVQDKIILAGDSIMAPHSGWGGAFCAHRVHAAVVCVNMGRGGRSTRSYRAEGSWDRMIAEASVEGYREVYVILGFGHNDANPMADRWTDLDTEFADNLRRQVAEVRAVGAVPVLSTPLARRVFNADGTLVNAIEPYAGVIRQVAAETGTPLIDLNAISKNLIEQNGKDWADSHAQLLPGQTAEEPAETELPAHAPTYRPGLKYDNVHLGRDGADYYANIIAQELSRLYPTLRSRLVRWCCQLN
ncbi:rhamnogalacturonan acetylesterase [Brevundimonas sp. EYE_349]|uniref:rhamnogalacturonan acetylesterase n=1 Tax=Brevundimonas sp. EYE_349 TaxID=2853455 RepID=UPI0020050716|nr:rhamnogalacturonan acetylesterase [Brevundimonas sp. EYE_349]MCK6103966.1 rhamnogalacturonan acetylesterase [Brevundimonas sp. EYE_349]